MLRTEERILKPQGRHQQKKCGEVGSREVGTVSTSPPPIASPRSRGSQVGCDSRPLDFDAGDDKEDVRGEDIRTLAILRGEDLCGKDYDEENAKILDA